ncbi:MAG: MalY/PatB family protein [Vicinamibacterales bacterium]
MSAAAPESQAFAPGPNGKFDFDAPYNRFGTNSVKYDQQIRVFGPNSIDVGMGIADMDFRAAPSITTALQDRLKHENWGYLDMPDSFAEGIIAWNKKRYGVDIPPDQLVITMGVHPGLIAALKTFSPVGSKVLLTTPTYNGFYGDLRASQTVAEESLMKFVNGRYELDFDDFERRIGPGTYSFILCNPQNPTGNCWSEADLMRIGEICLKRGVIVLADEIHCDFVGKGQKYTPFASLPDKAIVNNSVTFKAASKSFGLAAHKTAWFYSTNPELMKRIKVEHRADLNTLGIIANQAAYSGGEDWLNQVVEYVDGNHAFAVDFIKKNIPAFKAYHPQGTYLMWLDVTALAEKIDARGQAERHNRSKAANEPTRTPEQIVERWLVKNARVHLNAGHSYGKGGENHMRMNIATSRRTLEKALTNMANALNSPTTSMPV